MNQSLFNQLGGLLSLGMKLFSVFSVCLLSSPGLRPVCPWARSRNVSVFLYFLFVFSWRLTTIVIIFSGSCTSTLLLASWCFRLCTFSPFWRVRPRAWQTFKGKQHIPLKYLKSEEFSFITSYTGISGTGWLLTTYDQFSTNPPVSDFTFHLSFITNTRSPTSSFMFWFHCRSILSIFF